MTGACRVELVSDRTIQCSARVKLGKTPDGRDRFGNACSRRATLYDGAVGYCKSHAPPSIRPHLYVATALPLCACGCGEPVSPLAKWRRGHYRPPPTEARQCASCAKTFRIQVTALRKNCFSCPCDRDFDAEDERRREQLRELRSDPTRARVISLYRWRMRSTESRLTGELSGARAASLARWRERDGERQISDWLKSLNGNRGDAERLLQEQRDDQSARQVGFLRSLDERFDGKDDGSWIAARFGAVSPAVVVEDEERSVLLARICGSLDPESVLRLPDGQRQQIAARLADADITPGPTSARDAKLYEAPALRRDGVNHGGLSEFPALGGIREKRDNRRVQSGTRLHVPKGGGARKAREWAPNRERFNTWLDRTRGINPRALGWDLLASAEAINRQLNAGALSEEDVADLRRRAWIYAQSGGGW